MAMPSALENWPAYGALATPHVFIFDKARKLRFEGRIDDSERESGATLRVVQTQVERGLEGVGKDLAPSVVVAYEPVWAIGTGLTPTTADVEEAHGFIRKRLAKRHASAAEAVRILYGGSVKPSNAKELMAVSDVDGALVGGASLLAADFLGIAAAYR
jgi:triosephosphate isomerase